MCYIDELSLKKSIKLLRKLRKKDKQYKAKLTELKQAIEKAEYALHKARQEDRDGMFGGSKAIEEMRKLEARIISLSVGS